MNKPEMKSQPAAYDWNELQNYIENKYNVDLHNFRRDENGEHRDFWHFLLESLDIKRGCYVYLSSEITVYEQWQKDFLDLFLNEFGDHIRIWVDW